MTRDQAAGAPTPDTVAVATPPSRLRSALILVVLAASQLIIAIDYNIVYVALPSIGRDLGFSASTLQWVVSGYALTFGGLLLLGGRLADVLDRRRLFVVALALYAVASFAGGIAEDQVLLVAARMVQGLGGALLFPATLAIINTTFAEGPARNRAVGVWGAAGASGGALGALLGGLLTAGLGWRWTFFVNVPVAVLVAVLAIRFLPHVPAVVASVPGRTVVERLRNYDVPGSITVTIGALALVLGLVLGPQSGWWSVPTVGSFLAAAVFLALFFVIEVRTRAPLMPLRMFRNRSLSTSAALAAAFAASFGGQFYLLTTWLQEVHGFDAIRAGAAFVPLALAIVVGTNIGGRIVTRAGVRVALVVGTGLGFVGLLVVGLQLGGSASYATDVLPWIVLDGLGQGITWTAMWIAASAGVRSDEQGIASGITSTSQQIGGAVGLAVLVAVSTSASGAGTTALGHGIGHAFVVAAAIAGAGTVIALFGLRRPVAVPPTTRVIPTTTGPVTTPTPTRR